MAGEERRDDHIVTNGELIGLAEEDTAKGRVVTLEGELEAPAEIGYDHSLVVRRAETATLRILAEEGVGADLDAAKAQLKQNLGATLAALSFIGMLES